MVCFTKCFCSQSVMGMYNSTIILFCYNHVARISHYSGSRDQTPATITFLLSFLRDEEAREVNAGALKGKRQLTLQT